MMPRFAGLQSLPNKLATFIEPMECEGVANLRDGSQWVYENLCPPHKISGAFRIMWR
jgi:hypothetical protein